MDKHLRNKVSLANPWHFLGLGFGSGLAPIMPGTFGSLAAVPLLILMSLLTTPIFVVLTILASLVGILICKKTSESMGMHDHGSIVWDEIAGMMVTFLFVPIDIFTLVLGFIFFRFFDILKPWPISFLDKNVHGGFGIMIDDILAGFMACACLHILLHFI